MEQNEQEIRELVTKWMTATKAGDLAAVLELMDDDVLFLVPGREPFGKHTFIEGAQAMRSVHIDGTSEIQELKVLGDWAWMRTRLLVTVTPLGGTSSIRSGSTLTILKKKADGRWVVARDANLLGGG
jgi:uncharacterized protein (TIGR02246 family)